MYTAISTGDKRFSFHSVFSALYAVDGLLRERMFDLVGYAATIAVIMIYVIANYASKRRDKHELQNPVRIVRVYVH